ncbi:MAG: Lpg1974 family pore-forming outer membrane protein [Chlamydiota bacterium]
MLFLKKYYRFFSGIFFVTNLFCFSNSDRRISELEKQMLEIGGYNPAGTFGAHFGNASLGNSDWEVGVDLLLWQTQVGGTEYAYSVNHIQPLGTGFPLKGKISQMTFDWNFGFRIGGGKQNLVKGSDLFLTYTYYKTSASDGYHKELPSGFLGLTGFLDPAIVAKSDYHLNYQNIDVEFGRSYYVSRQVLVKSNIGLKFSRISQKQTSHYGFDVQSEDLVSFSSNLKDQNLFLGIGPRIGFCSRWYLGREVSLYNKIGAALLYGYFQVKDHYDADEKKILNQQMIKSLSEINLIGSAHRFSPFTEMLIGASWNRSYLKDKVILTISVSYETLYFWREAQKLVAEGVIKTDSSSNLISSSRVLFERQAEDLGFRGLSLKVEVDF